MCTIGAPEDADYREREVVCMVERRRCGNIRPHDNTSSVMKSGGLVGNAEGEFRQVPLARAIGKPGRKSHPWLECDPRSKALGTLTSRQERGSRWE